MFLHSCCLLLNEENISEDNHLHSIHQPESLFVNFNRSEGSRILTDDTNLSDLSVADEFSSSLNKRSAFVQNPRSTLEGYYNMGIGSHTQANGYDSGYFLPPKDQRQQFWPLIPDFADPTIHSASMVSTDPQFTPNCHHYHKSPSMSMPLPINNHGDKFHPYYAEANSIKDLNVQSSASTMNSITSSLPSSKAFGQPKRPLCQTPADGMFSYNTSSFSLDSNPQPPPPPPTNNHKYVVRHGSSLTEQDQVIALIEKQRRRKESHNAVERRRRDHINEMIHRLTVLVEQDICALYGSEQSSSPTSFRKDPIEGSAEFTNGDGSPRLNKGEVLEKAVERIQELSRITRLQALRLHQIDPTWRVPNTTRSTQSDQSLNEFSDPPAHFILLGFDDILQGTTPPSSI